MASLDRAANWIIRIRAVSIIITWFHLWGPITGLLIAAIGTVWAVMTGVSTPIAMMAAFCTITAAAYLGLVPMAYRVLQRAQDMPTRLRPAPQVWQHLPQYKLYEAACLLADLEPDIPIVGKPGDANGWYRALCIAIQSGELDRLPTPFDSQHIFGTYQDNGTIKNEYRPYEETVISRKSLQEFAIKRELRRPFLLEGSAP